MGLRRLPVEPPRCFGDRAADADAAAEHVDVLRSQDCHLTPAQAGIGEEQDNEAVRATRGGEGEHLDVRQVAPVGVLALREPHPVAGITGESSILDRSAENHAEEVETVLDGGDAYFVFDHLRHPISDG